MINAYFKKVKSWYEASQKDLYTAGVIFLVGMAGFGLGRLSILWPEKEPIVIDENIEFRSENLEKDKQFDMSDSGALSSKFQALNSPQKRYVASKSGASYHFPWCPGALKIKEENKIWFQTKEEAQGRGYKPAGNCDGL